MSNPLVRCIQITYFAQLREERGVQEERLETLADTPAALYDELCDRYGFTLDRRALRVAVNHEFQSFDAPLNDGDIVVFIPPVAGG